MTHVCSIAESVVILTDQVEPDELADAQHTGAKADQLSDDLIEDGTAGSGSFGPTEKRVFL